jgi:endonuclease-3 related protein
LKTDPVSACLRSIYEALYRHYGPQRWWPAEEPFEVVVGAILTQNTAWVNVEKAIANLKRAGVLHPAGLQAIEPEALAELVRPSGYYNQKARKIKAFVAHLSERYGGDLAGLFARPLPELRAELLGLFGIGPETADSIILYAAEKPIFVIDTYTRRVFGHLGFAEADASYEDFQRLFMAHLPHDVRLFNEYHGLLVHHAKYVCAKKPRCAGCVLAGCCGEGRNGDGQDRRSV